MSETTTEYNTKNVVSTDSTVTDKIRNEFAAYGLEILKRSVLLVLYEENLGEELRPDKIRERLGIPPLPPYHGGAMLVSDILQRLWKDELVDPPTRKGWKITKKGVEFIEG